MITFCSGGFECISDCYPYPARNPCPFYDLLRFFSSFASVNSEARNNFVAPANSLRDQLVSSHFCILLALRSRLDSRHALGAQLHYGPDL